MKNKKFVVALTTSGIILTSISGAHLLQANQLNKKELPHVSPIGEISNSRLRTLNGSKAVFAKAGNQKVLTLLVNISDSPFENDEKFYSDMVFGSGIDSVKSYLENQSNGKMTISPVETTGTQYPGVIKLDVDVNTLPEIGAKEYDKQLEVANKLIEQVKSQINFASADTNGDKAFNDSWQVDVENDADELFINVIFSGNMDVNGGGNKVQAWPHSPKFNTKVGEYTLQNSGLITSEKASNRVIGMSTYAHEFLHNLNARDMYADTSSIDLWSIMSKSYGNRDGSTTGYHANTLDPIHKLRMGWTKPTKIDLTKPSTTIDVSKDKSYWIQHPTNNDIVYVLDYRDFDDVYEKANYRYGLRGDGLIVWQINKSKVAVDWNDDWQLNTGGMRSSVFVIPKNTGESATVENALTPVGSTLTIDSLDGVSIKVNNHQLVVKTNVKPPEITYTINAIDRKFKQGTNITNKKLLEGVTVQGSDGSDVTKDSNLTVKHTALANKPGDYTATYTAEYKGKTITKTIKVTVEKNDNIMNPPVIHAEDKTIKVGSSWNPKEGITAEDGHGTDISKDIQVVDDKVNPSEPGTYIVVYKVTDSIGQETIKQIVVTVVKDEAQKPDKDTTAPVIKGVETKVIKVGEIFKPLDGVSATDNVDGVVEVRVAFSDVKNKVPGTYKVVYEAIDKAGNKSTVERVVKVIGDEDSEGQNDTIAPVIKAKSDKIKIPVGADFDELSIVTATDNIDKDVTQNIRVTSSDLNLEKAGVYTISYEVNDKAGNVGKLSVKVEVYNSRVQFVIPDIRIHQGDKFDPKANIKVLDASGKDVTKDVEVTGDTVKVDELGKYKVKYTYTDKDGNKLSHVRIVEVVSKDVNIEPPTIKIDYSVIKVGSKFEPLDGITAESAKGDNLTKSIELVSGEIDANTVGLYVLVYSVKDADGNVAMKERKMLVLPMDIEEGAPHIFLKRNKIIKGSKFEPTDIAVAIDKEDGILEDLVVKKNNVDIDKLGFYTVSYSAIDSDSNVANRSFEIEVVEQVSMGDTQEPSEQPNKDTDKDKGDTTLDVPPGGELNVGTGVTNGHVPKTGAVASSGLFAGIITTLSGIVLSFRNRRK